MFLLPCARSLWVISSSGIGWPSPFIKSGRIATRRKNSLAGMMSTHAPRGTSTEKVCGSREVKSCLVGIDQLGDTADEFLDVARVGMPVGVQMRAEFPGAALQPRAVPLLE